MVDATGLVEECVSIRPGNEVFQIFGLHVGQTEVLIGAEQVLWGRISFVLYDISLAIKYWNFFRVSVQIVPFLQLLCSGSGF